MVWISGCCCTIATGGGVEGYLFARLWMMSYCDKAILLAMSLSSLIDVIFAGEVLLLVSCFNERYLSRNSAFLLMLAISMLGVLLVVVMLLLCI